jgi:four helix bundle protein
VVAEIGSLHFEKLVVWQKSRELVKYVFSVTKGLSDRDFKSQLQRATLSIMNNIAEGHESGSAKSFGRYLKIAKGSSGEVRSLFYAGLDLKYISFGRHREGLERSSEISKMISGLVRSLK